MHDLLHRVSQSLGSIRGSSDENAITVDNRVTDNGSIRVESGKINTHTGRKRPTMALRLGFLIENFFVKLCSQVFYRDSYTNPYIFVGFPSH